MTLDVRTRQVFASRFQTRTYSIANPAAYNVYRLRIDSVANPSTALAVQLAELELLGAPGYLYFWSFGDGATAISSTKSISTSV